MSSKNNKSICWVNTQKLWETCLLLMLKLVTKSFSVVNVPRPILCTSCQFQKKKITLQHWNKYLKARYTNWTKPFTTSFSFTSSWYNLILVSPCFSARPSFTMIFKKELKTYWKAYLVLIKKHNLKIDLLKFFENTLYPQMTWKKA